MPDNARLTRGEDIVRKITGKRDHATPLFVIERAAKTGGEDDRTVELSFVSDTPITHFLYSRWAYVDIELSMNRDAIRTERLENGAPLLMDHDTRDLVGVVRSFKLDDSGKCRATVEFSDSQRGQEVYNDVLKGIRQCVSAGFVIHKLTLVEERKKGNDLYRAEDWEPLEISLVSVPADISVGVGRSLERDAAVVDDAEEMCPDCEMPMDECNCTEEVQQSHTAANSTGSNGSQKRAISTNGERKMPNDPQNGTGAPAVETRSAEQIEAQRVGDIIAFARVYGEDAEQLARQMTAGSKDVTLEDVRSAIAKGQKPSTQVPVQSAEDLARAAGQSGTAFEKGAQGEVVIDQATRQVVDQRTQGLSNTQLNAVFSKEYRDAFRSYLRNKGVDGMTPTHIRALNEGADTEGGFLVPAEFLAKMVEREAATTSVRNFVTKLQTGSDKLTMPKNNYSASNLYTTGVRVSWVDEQTGPNSESDARNFGNITIPVHTAMMYHDVTNNMVEDSAFDILGWLSSKFRETADVVTDNVIINGTGIGQPNGILLNPDGTNEPASVVSGSGSALTADGLMDLSYSLLGRYTPNARFVFNRLSTEKAIAKLKDNNNRYLFAAGVNTDGLATARPQTLLGFPFISSDFMPDIASNAFPIIFGDLAGYYLVERVGFSIQILNEIVATNNKVRVLGRMRIGGQVAEDWRLKLQKVST